MDASPWIHLLTGLAAAGATIALILASLPWVYRRDNARQRRRQMLCDAQDAAVRLRTRKAAHAAWLKSAGAKGTLLTHDEETYLMNRITSLLTPDSGLTVTESWLRTISTTGLTHVEELQWHEAIEAIGAEIRRLDKA